MANRQTGNMDMRHGKRDDDSINFRELVIYYGSYWPFFLIAIAIMMAGAYVFNKIQKPVYTTIASLELQDSKDQPTQEKSALQELDLFTAPKIVENEMEILKSRQLVRDVVDHLQLWITYKPKKVLTKADLYGISPIKLNVLKADTPISNHTIEVKILDPKTYLVVEKNKQLGQHHFGDTITTTFGTWTITPTSDLNDYIGKAIQVNISNPDMVVPAYQAALVVELKDKLASVVQISINDANPQRGRDFVNNLIYYYNQAEIDQKNNVTKSTLTFIDKRLDSLKGELDNAESKVAGYRSGNGLTDINAQSQMYLQDVQANSGKLNDVNIQLSIIDGLEQYVNAPGNSDKSVPSTMGISDQALVSLIQRLSDLQLKKTEMLGTLPPGNPQFDPLNKQIAITKGAIKEDIKNLKDNLITTRNSLQSVKANVQSSIKNVPGQEKQLVGLSRQQTIKENLYNYLLQKREEISLKYASSISDARLVDVAYTLPLNASKKYTPFAIALLLGLILPAGVIYSKDVVKNSISKRRDIESVTSVPVLAEFNYIKLPSELVMNTKNGGLNYLLVEQFRHLRTQLNFLNQASDNGNVTMITSSLANEGKSFVSSNLAISLARAGKKTILLEMDIYKPKLSRMFDLKDGVRGLSEYLEGKANKKLIINKSAEYPNLDVISCGAFTANFSELLDQPQFSSLIEELRLQYDHVLIDTPPIRSINDAYSIARVCDLTLYVVRYNHTSKTLLPFIQKLHNENKLPGMNIVFNGLKEGRDGEGYKYERYEYSRLQN